MASERIPRQIVILIGDVSCIPLSQIQPEWSSSTCGYLLSVIEFGISVFMDMPMRLSTDPGSPKGVNWIWWLKGFEDVISYLRKRLVLTTPIFILYYFSPTFQNYNQMRYSPCFRSKGFQFSDVNIICNVPQKKFCDGMKPPLASREHPDLTSSDCPSLCRSVSKPLQKNDPTEGRMNQFQLVG